ncbi:MAG: prolyl oligopeptidase family serine peptidase [Pseudomonadota bacterium]
MWRAITLILCVGWSGLACGQLQSELTLEHGGQTRLYDLYVPPTSGGGALPLVIDFHYVLWSTGEYRSRFGFNPAFHSSDLVTAFPHSGTGWNSGLGAAGRDDVGFVLAMIDEIARQTPIDQDRIYIMGFSDGGEMAYRLLCEAPDRFAAAATIAAPLRPEFEIGCRLPRAIPLMAFRGMTDQLVGFQGGTNSFGETTLGANETMNFWRQQNGCQGPITSEDFAPQHSCRVDNSCNVGTEVRLCVVEATEVHRFRHSIFDNAAGIDLRFNSLDFMTRFVRPEAAFEIDGGLTGAWFDPDNPGQGLLVEPIPSNTSLFAAWFTFDVSASGDGGDEQRWLTLQGDYVGAEADLDILSTSSGRFLRADPAETRVVGSAKLRFFGCTEARLSYQFDDGLGGEIALTRLLPDTLCGNPIGNAPIPKTLNTMNAGLSGAWFDPSTPGQGLVFDVVPAAQVLFAAWFTFGEASDQKIGAVEQRWMTAQGSTLGVESEMVISQTMGGQFDLPQSVSTSPVGGGRLTFVSCTEANFDFELDSGETGSIPLTRLAPDVFCEALTR